MLFLFSSCANYQLKQACEKVNWFDHAQSIAYSGRYLEEDSLVKDCRSVDTIQMSQADLGFKLGRDKMCSYDEIYNRGKEGQNVYFGFCDGLSQAQMKSKYQAGLRIFCTEPSGSSYGKSGAIYQKVCPAESETAFMKGYKPGRYQYLKLVIKNKSNQLVDIEEEYKTSIALESSLNSQYNLIPVSQICRNKEVYDEATKKSSIQYICTTDPVITSQRDETMQRLNKARSNSAEILEKKKKIKSDLENAEHETLSLN